MRLEQVLINLIDNALKYTDKGEIRVSMKNADNNIKIIQMLEKYLHTLIASLRNTVFSTH